MVAPHGKLLFKRSANLHVGLQSVVQCTLPLSSAGWGARCWALLAMEFVVIQDILQSRASSGRRESHYMSPFTWFESKVFSAKVIKARS